MTWRRKRLGLVLLAVLALAGASGGGWWRWTTPPPPPPVDLAGADPEVAKRIESTRREVVARPRSSAAWGKLGMVLQVNGKPREAIVCLAQAERLDPREPRWPYYQGMILERSDLAEAVACLRRALANGRDSSVEPSFRLARLLLEQGALDEAEQVLEQARQKKRNDPHGYLLRAQLAVARQRWQEVLMEVRGCWLDEHSRQLARTLAVRAWQHLNEPARAEELLAEAKRMPRRNGCRPTDPGATRWPRSWKGGWLECGPGATRRKDSGSRAATTGPPRSWHSWPAIIRRT